jgi:hypothetical protein
MSAFVKTYPRAKVSRHPRINGWVIDLIHRAGARPNRVAATYVTAEFAARAALVKLGVKVPPAAPVAKGFQVFEPKRLTAARDYGTCAPCGRPMRPAGSKSADYPGTTLRQRDGMCQSCYQKAKREGVAA